MLKEDRILIPSKKSETFTANAYIIAIRALKSLQNLNKPYTPKRSLHHERVETYDMGTDGRCSEVDEIKG